MASLIIGAGMFSLPFVFARSGFIVGTAYLVLMCAIMAEVHKSYAEIIDKSGEELRFVGYAEKYLGRGGRVVGSISGLLGILITLTIYLVLSVSFIKLIIPSIPSVLAVVLFWAVGSLLIAVGVKKFAGIDVLFFIGIALIVGIVAIFGLLFGRTDFLAASPADALGVFFPLAPVLFSLSGRSAISSIREYFSSKGYSVKNFKKSIFIGTIIPIFVYGLFVVGISMLSSGGVADDAVSGIDLLPSYYLFLLGALGIFSLITSFIFLGSEFKGIIEKDFKTPSVASLLISIGTPILLFFCGLTNFLTLVGIAGGIFLATESLLVIAIRRRATSRKRPFDFILIAIFLIAVIYEIVRLAI